MYDAVKTFGKDRVAEIDSTAKKAEKVASKIISIFKGKSKRSLGTVDWLSLIVKNDDLQKFFAYQ